MRCFVYSVFFLALATQIGGQMIRQCTCDEMDECKMEMVATMAQCAMQCKDKLDAARMGRAQAVMQCLAQLRGGGESCFAGLKSRMCTTQYGKMIPQQPQGMMGGRGASHPFLQCMMSCKQQMSGGQHEMPHAACARKNNCGVIKPSPMEFMQTIQACRPQMQAKKQQVCACLNRQGETQLCQAIQSQQGPGGLMG